MRIITTFAIVFLVTQTLVGQKNGIRLNIRSLFGYQKANEVTTDTMITSINPTSETKQNSYDFTIGYFRKINQYYLFIDTGIQYYNRFAQQDREIDSLLQKGVQKWETKGIILNFGIQRFYELPNTKFSVSVGFGLYSSLNYFDNYSSENYITNFKNHYLLGSTRQINSNNIFTIGPNAEINLFYNFKNFALGLNHNSRIYFEYENGILVDSYQVFGRNKSPENQTNYFHEIRKSVISKSQYFTISLMIKF